jgi:hypothetical protein
MLRIRLFGAHAQQPKKGSPGPRRLVVLLAVRAVTESAVLHSETVPTPDSWERQRIRFLVLRDFGKWMPRLAWLVIG